MGLQLSRGFALWLGAPQALGHLNQCGGRRRRMPLSIDKLLDCCCYRTEFLSLPRSLCFLALHAFEESDPFLLCGGTTGDESERHERERERRMRTPSARG